MDPIGWYLLQQQRKAQARKELVGAIIGAGILFACIGFALTISF